MKSLFGWLLCKLDNWLACNADVTWQELRAERMRLCRHKAGEPNVD